MVKINKYVEGIFLVLFIALFLHAGVGVLWENKIQHDFPMSYLASDAFQHQTRAEGIKAQGGYLYEPYYISGGYTDVIGFYPPLTYHIGIMFSEFAGLEVYDGLYLLVFLTAVLSALLAYSIIRKYNRNVALLSMPIMLFIFYRTNYTPFTWGNWTSLTGQMFLIGSLYALYYIDLKKSWFLYGVLFSAVLLTHTSEAVFGFLFAVAYLLYHVYIKRRINTPEVKNMVTAGVMSFILTVYYLIIFKFSWSLVFPFEFKVVTSYAKGQKVVEMMDLGALAFVVMAGVVLAALLIYRTWLKEKSTLFNKHFALLFGFFGIIIGYGNLYGLNVRAFQLRFYWPIYVAVFFGLALYWVVKRFTRKTVVFAAISLILACAFVFATVPKVPKVEPFTTPGLMNQYHWEGIMWLKGSVPEDATVMFYRGDTYGQDALLRNIQRKHVMTSSNMPHKLSALTENGSLVRNIDITKVGDCCGTYYPHRTGGWFDYGYYYTEEMKEKRTAPGDICEYDYFVVDQFSQDQNFQMINRQIITQLLASESIEEVHNNGLMMIMKNNAVGGECA